MGIPDQLSYIITFCSKLLLLSSIGVKVGLFPLIGRDVWGQELSRERLQVLLAVDASGSMRNSDPNDYRIIATQSIISLLPETSLVSVITFAEDFDIVVDWRTTSEKQILFNQVSKIGKSGRYTDFCAALEGIIEQYEKVGYNGRKVVIILSDGDMDPNPNRYGIYSLQRPTKEQLVLVANRVLYDELIPKLRDLKIEVFSVGLGDPNLGRTIEQISLATNPDQTKRRFYWTRDPKDLISIFIEFMNDWQNLMVYQRDEGLIETGRFHEIYIDQFVSNASLVSISENGTIKVLTREDNEESPVDGTHPWLQLVPLINQNIPNIWRISYIRGSGQYAWMLIGKSRIAMILENLKPEYLFNELIEGRVAVTIDDHPFTPALFDSFRIVMRIDKEGDSLTSKQLPYSDGKFNFRIEHLYEGKYHIRFTLFATDSTGHPLLPRPTQEYTFRVYPGFYVKPDHMSIGTLRKNESRVDSILLISGFDEPLEIIVESSLFQFSRGTIDIKRSPYIVAPNVSLGGSGEKWYTITIGIPPKGKWGDYQGRLIFRPHKGVPDTVTFQCHIYSFWEHLTLIIIIVGILIVVILGLWIYVNVIQGNPEGRIIFLEVPGGEVPPPVQLYHIRRRWYQPRNFFRINRLNEIDINSHGSEICLKEIPVDFRLSFIFWNFGTSYIRNTSENSGNPVNVIFESDITSHFQLRRGDVLPLRRNIEIQFCGYRIQYQNLNLR